MNLPRTTAVAGAALLTTATLAITAPTATAAQTESRADSAHAAQARAAGLTERQASRLQNSIDAHLKTMRVPARQSSFNEIRANNGAVIEFPAPGVRDSSCRYGRLCLWAGDNYDHAKLVFKQCAYRDLSNYGFNDRLTSYKNNQTRGTRSKFYNWDGRWDYLFDSVAPHKESDLQGTGWNNKVDRVKVC